MASITASIVQYLAPTKNFKFQDIISHQCRRSKYLQLIHLIVLASETQRLFSHPKAILFFLDFISQKAQLVMAFFEISFDLLEER